MAKRLRDNCKLQDRESLWRQGRGFVMRGLPMSEDRLKKLPPFEFENWAVLRLDGLPNKAKVADMGMDGKVFLTSAMPSTTAERTGHLGFMDNWLPIQVKQQDKTGRPDIDKFEAVLVRENKNKGFFVSFDYTSDALQEIRRFAKQTGKVIKPLKVAEMLDDDQLVYAMM